MQATTASTATPTPLLYARHLIGMGIVALANPLIYYDSQAIGMWLVTWVGPIVLGLVAYGLYAVFLTERAKRAWPKSFFILVWVCLGLFMLGQWAEFNGNRTQKTAAQAPKPPQNNGSIPFNGKLDSPASSAFDPTTARPVDEPTSSPNQFDPSTARPVSN
ncbi:hypothetical protein [Comamonas sp. 26]|uniref:hypothetical protein n=1 Tax=Comamonas sp. 26 TaxID=2035201 RepID=UPI000C547E00|nr:hypothetical protein [Comamonas sp. 26]PIG07841.1 hypothetical protein CLU84_0668 [Comamonas sp. 26]